MSKVHYKAGMLMVWMLIILLSLCGCRETMTQRSQRIVEKIERMSNEERETAETSSSRHKLGEAGAEDETLETEEAQSIEPVSYLLSFAGDCTIGNMCIEGKGYLNFTNLVGEDYGWCFREVVSYFEEDDLTFVNMESVLGNHGYAYDKQFCFRAPAQYVTVLKEGSVEAVTMANNHSMDYGPDGYAFTLDMLDSVGIDYVEDDGITYLETDSGLKIGMYAAYEPRSNQLSDAMEMLKRAKDAGAVDIILCAFHWGNEGEYRPDYNQTYIGHLAVDLGADIVYGSHPHVLQPVEEYNGGIIYYSLGNFVFGGSATLVDFDTAIVQQEVIREADGSVHLGETIMIPCAVSGQGRSNNYQPVPYEEGTEEYERALSKLLGTYTGDNMAVNY